MTTGYIVWNGNSSIDYGLGVEHHPNSTRPEQKMDVYSVPGRSGDIIMPQYAWENVIQSYDIYLNHGISYSETAQRSMDDLADWLMGPSGYCQLEDEWEPDVFRMAYYRGPVDIENLMSVSGRATIEFVCKPQRYLNSGQIELTLNSSTTSVWNPTIYKAQPIITIPASGSVTLPYTLTIGSYVVSINTDDAIIIDCEEQDCYDSNGTNMNSYVTLTSGEFPVLVEGSNTCTLVDAGSTTYTFTMVPNFWRL